MPGSFMKGEKLLNVSHLLPAVLRSRSQTLRGGPSAHREDTMETAVSREGNERQGTQQNSPCHRTYASHL